MARLSGRRAACGGGACRLLGCHRWPVRPAPGRAAAPPDGSAWRTISSRGAGRSASRRAVGSPAVSPRRSSGFVERPDGSLVVAAGSPDADWALNLLEDPACRVTLGDATWAATATPLEGVEHADAVRSLILRYGTPAENLGAGPSFELRRRWRPRGAPGPRSIATWTCLPPGAASASCAGRCSSRPRSSSSRSGSRSRAGCSRCWPSRPWPRSWRGGPSSGCWTTACRRGRRWSSPSAASSSSWS